MSELIELIGDINEWIEKANEIVHEAVVEATKSTIEQVVEAAKDLAPVETGKLRDNIQGSVTAGGHFGRVQISAKTVPYAPWVHFGTVNMPGNPFLYEAADQVGAVYPSKIRDQIKAKNNEQ
jgi:HK97 gp10 family phage protein